VFDFAQNLINYAKKKGFNQSEVYIEKFIEKSFDLKNESDYSKGLSETIGVALRLIKDDYVFFVNSTLNDEKKVEDMIDSVSLISFSKKIGASILPKSDYEFSFSEVNEYDESKIKETIYEMSSIAKNFDKRIQQVKSSSININEKYIWVLNSFGLKAYQAYNVVESQVSVLAKDKIEEIGWYDEKGFSLNNIDFTNVAKTASERAGELGLARLKPG
jgi:PmbA protein